MADSRPISSIFKDMHHRCVRAGLLEGRLTSSTSKLPPRVRDQPGLSPTAPPADANFWRFPTVSMGSARSRYLPGGFMRYSGESEMIPHAPQSLALWAMANPTSPESMGSLTLGSREKLDNLIFVVNCNLQRLDGPVRAMARSLTSWKRPTAAPAGT